MYILNICLCYIIHIYNNPPIFNLYIFLFLYASFLNDFRSKQHVKFSDETVETWLNNTYIYIYIYIHEQDM